MRVKHIAKERCKNAIRISSDAHPHDGPIHHHIPPYPPSLHLSLSLCISFINFVKKLISIAHRREFSISKIFQKQYTTKSIFNFLKSTDTCVDSGYSNYFSRSTTFFIFSVFQCFCYIFNTLQCS